VFVREFPCTHSEKGCTRTLYSVSPVTGADNPLVSKYDRLDLSTFGMPRQSNHFMLLQRREYQYNRYHPRNSASTLRSRNYRFLPLHIESDQDRTSRGLSRRSTIVFSLQNRNSHAQHQSDHLHTILKLLDIRFTPRIPSRFQLSQKDLDQRSSRFGEVRVVIKMLRRFFGESSIASWRTGGRAR